MRHSSSMTIFMDANMDYTVKNVTNVSMQEKQHEPLMTESENT